MRYGFIEPIITPDNYVLGSIGGEVLQADGQWDEFLPQYEPQAENYETSGCTCWGTENALEILFKRKFQFEPNFSERYPYNLANIEHPGADPHFIGEVCRKYGFINQDSLPVPPTYEEFKTPRPMEMKYLLEGKEWMEKWDFKHEWVFTGAKTKEQRIETMKKALTFSPLGVAVSAWHEQNDIYVDFGMANNHWCVCYGYDDEKQAWKIFDSYDHSTKLYSYDSAINFAKRYSIEKKLQEKQNWLQQLLTNFWSFIKDILQ